MVLGLDFYDTITAYPVALRKLATDVLEAGGSVHIVTAIKRVNEERTRRHVKDSRVPHTSLEIVFYEKYEEIPKLKIPVYKGLNCDIIVEDNIEVLFEASLRGMCGLQVSGISNSPLVVHGR